jgi:hypothetical protein
MRWGKSKLIPLEDSNYETKMLLDQYARFSLMHSIKSIFIVPTIVSKFDVNQIFHPATDANMTVKC